MYTQLSLFLCILLFNAPTPEGNINSNEDHGETAEVPAENKALVNYIGGLIESQTRYEYTLKAHLKIKDADHKDKASKGLRAIAESKRKLSAFRSKASKLKLSSKDYKALLRSANQEHSGIIDIIGDIINDIIDWWNDDPKDPVGTVPALPSAVCQGAGRAVESDCMRALSVLKGCEAGDLSGGLTSSECANKGRMEQMNCRITKNTPGAQYIPPAPRMEAEAAAMCEGINQIIFREQNQKVTADGN